MLVSLLEVLVFEIPAVWHTALTKQTASKHEGFKPGHICCGIGNVATGLVLNISTSLIFAFHLKAWKGKVTKCVFTRSTQPAYLQLSPNLVLPSFSGLAGKYRFSCYSRHIIYLINCVFWHVHYLPDGLTDGREQMLSFVQTVTLFMSNKSLFCCGHFVSHSGCFHPFTVEQKASTGEGGRAHERAGGWHIFHEQWDQVWG